MRINGTESLSSSSKSETGEYIKLNFYGQRIKIKNIDGA